MASTRRGAFTNEISRKAAKARKKEEFGIQRYEDTKGARCQTPGVGERHSCAPSARGLGFVFLYLCVRLSLFAPSRLCVKPLSCIRSRLLESPPGPSPSRFREGEGGRKRHCEEQREDHPCPFNLASAYSLPIVITPDGDAPCRIIRRLRSAKRGWSIGLRSIGRRTSTR